MNDKERFEHESRLCREALKLPEPERTEYVRRNARTPEIAEAVLKYLAMPSDPLSGPASGAKEAVPKDFKIPRVLGGFEIIEELGGGATSRVYKARHRVLQDIVALKVFIGHGGLDEKALDDAIEEGRRLAKLKHPNIARVQDIDTTSLRVMTTSGREVVVPFLVMEFVDGEPLGNAFRRPEWNHSRAFEVAISIADTIAYAHAQSVVHRDLKPDNIMLTKDGQVKVLDFGISRLLQTAHAEPSPDGSVLTRAAGSIPWMSPEQLQDGEVTAMADVWAFACVLYESLVGQSGVRYRFAYPDGPSPTPPPTDEVRCPHRTAIHSLLMDCWSHDPADRPKMRELADRLKELVTPSPKLRIALSVAASVLVVLGVIRLLSPIGAEWKDDTLLLSTRFPFFTPTTTGFFAPAPWIKLGQAQALTADVLPRPGGFFRQTVALGGAYSQDHSALVLVNWRGKVDQQFDSENPLPDSKGLPGSLQWNAFHRMDTEQGPTLMVPLRSVTAGFTLMQAYTYDGFRLNQRGAVWARGHIERFPQMDIDQDGELELVGLGFVSGLPPVGADTKTGGRSVLQSINLETMASSDAPHSIDDVPDLETYTVAHEDLGLLLSFDVDWLSGNRTSSALTARWIDAGVLLVSCHGASPGEAVEYRIAFENGRPVGCLGATMTTSYKEWAQKRGITRADMIAEMDRIAASVGVLTPDGWRALRYLRTTDIAGEEK